MIYSTRVKRTILSYHVHGNDRALMEGGGASDSKQLLYKLARVYKMYSRSPRWTSGSPRMLLVLVREFESRRGKISNLSAIKKEGSTEVLRPPSMAKHNSTQVDEGRKS